MASLKYQTPYNKPLPIPRYTSRIESLDTETDKITDSTDSLPQSQSTITSESSKKNSQLNTPILPIEEVLTKFIFSARKKYAASGSNKTKLQLETEEFFLSQLENVVKKTSILSATSLIKDQDNNNIVNHISDFLANTSSKIYSSNLLSITQSDNTPTIINYSLEDLQKLLRKTKYSVCDDSITSNMDLEVKDDSSLSSDGTMRHRASIKNKSHKRNSIVIQNTQIGTPLSFSYNVNPNYIDIKPYAKMSDVSNNSIFVRIKSLILYENLEPLFASIALYNVNLKKKITETITIDISSKDNLYVSNLCNQNFGSESNSFLFSRGEHPIEDLYLFIRFEKILAKGSLSKVMAYYETQTHDSKSINKSKASAIKICENLSSFKMPVGWIYFPLAEILTSDINPKAAKFPKMKMMSIQNDIGAASENTLRADDLKTSTSDTQTSPFEFMKNIFNRADDGDFIQDFPYKIIAENKASPFHNKKNHIFYGTLCMEIYRTPSVIPNNCFDTSRILLSPSNNIPENIFRPTDVVTKLESFSSSKYPICHQKIINRLFLYPIQLNCSQRPSSAKNFQVIFFLLDKEITGSYVLDQAIKTKSNQMQSTAVQYRNRMPYFYEEMKFELPHNIDKNFHILVVVRSITVTTLLVPSVSIVGFSWLPLFNKDCINNGYFELPLSLDILPPLYSKYYPNDCSLQLKWLDNKKPLISFRLKLVSSLYTKSSYFRSCFPNEPMSINIKKASTNEESSLSINSSFPFYFQAMEMIANLSNVKPKLLIDHFYFISNYLLSLIDTLMPADVSGIDYEKCKNASIKAFYQLTDCVSRVALNTKSMQDEIGRNSLLGAYTSYFSLNKKINFSYIKSDYPPFATSVAMSIISSQSEDIKDFENLYKSIAELIILGSKESSSIFKIMKYPWFYFELMIKSLLIAWSNKPKSDSTRFACDKAFIDMLFTIVDIFINEIHSLIKMNLLDNILTISASISRFLLDLFFIIDRGVVISLLSLYIKKVRIENNETSRLIQISTLSCFICNEKVLAADLISFDVFKSSLGEQNFHKIYLTSFESVYKKNLFIFPILINEINYSLKDTVGSSSFELLINSIIRMICRLEFIDSIKYSNKSQEGPKSVSPLLISIACIMLPIIYQLFFIVAQHTLREETSNSLNDSRLPSISGTSTIKINKRLDFQNESKIMNIISTSGIKTLEGLFFIFIWIVRTVHYDLLLQSWRHFSSQDRLACLDTLLLCLQIFPYSENPDSSLSLNRKSFLKNTPQVGTLSKMDILKELILNGPTRKESRRDLKSQTGQYRNFINLAKTPLKATIDLDHKTAQIMRSYLNIISNETIFYFLSLILNETESKIDKLPILAKCLEVLTKLLLTKQTIILHTNVLTCLQIYIKKFSVILFESSSEICADLVGALVMLCKSPFGDIRENSSEILFVMLKMNFKVKKNLSRMTYMITSAIFNSISNEMKNVFTTNLQNSLYRIISYSLRNNKYLINEDINHIFQNLISILKDTTKIYEMNNNLYSKIDHMHRIISRLGSMPDLRIHWLLQISDILMAKEYFLQAALCVLHASIVSFRYICFTTDKMSYLPYGLSIFKNITSNYDDEYFDFSESSNSADNQIYSKKYLTPNGFITLINLCISIFTKAKAHNYIVSLIDIVYRSYQFNNQYHEAAKFTEIHVQSLNSLEKQGTVNDMCSYFRVAFYGEKCEDLNNAEFIYAEPPHTKLSQFFDSIKFTYSQIFPAGLLEIIMNSAPVEKEKLNPTRCYIQITYVSPCSLTTCSENYISDNQYPQDYRYFYYLTPFTISGKARGELLDQYQRKNILEVEKFFPCTLIRQKIISCREEIIAPVDVMISDLGKRARDIQKVLLEFPLDLKILQLNIQGCISATVNQGPFEAAKTFLEPFLLSDVVYQTSSPENLLYLKSINSLQLTCQFLLDTCKQALLSVEATEIPSDNMEYWDCMGEMYNKFNDKLSILLNNVRDKLKQICIN